MRALSIRGASRKSLPLATVKRLAELSREISDEQETILTQLSNSAHGLIESAKGMVIVGLKLLEAKKLVGHGYFLAWLEEDKQHISERTAQRYMAFAREWQTLGPALDRVAKSASCGAFERVELVRAMIRSAMGDSDAHVNGHEVASWERLLRCADSFLARFGDVKPCDLTDDVRDRLRVAKRRIEELGI